MPTLNGRKTLRVKPGTKHGTVQRLRGEGPPKLNGGRGNGDIHYRFVIDVPSELNEEPAQGRRRSSPRRSTASAPQALRGAEAVSEETTHRAPRRLDAHRRGARPRCFHDLGRRGAGRDASADAADVRGARPDRAPSARRRARACTRTRTSSCCAASSEMTVELGLNLAGVERVLALEAELDEAHRRLAELEAQRGARQGRDGGGAGARAPFAARRLVPYNPAPDRARAKRRGALAVLAPSRQQLTQPRGPVC